MGKWPTYPVVCELNTWVWLNDLSRDTGRPVTLGDVPQSELERLASYHLDALWLMGVWERSPRGRQVACEYPDLQAEYRRALPDFTMEDVVGSPYAIYRYNVDPSLGGDDGLAALRRRLEKLELRLILDFVPNHLSIDHPWLADHPERLLQGDPIHLQTDPNNYFSNSSNGRQRVFAHGRDPISPALWTDTVQLDYRKPETRQAMTEILRSVAGRCDGVRCDMAMLVTRDVFLRTWGGEMDPPGSEFWPEAIRSVKDAHPDFLMLAEVYWDMEYHLQQQGFDYTYDKFLYDKLRGGDPAEVWVHLTASLEYQRHLARFIENHDLQTAIEAFGIPRSRAAATLAMGLPGMRLLTEGQLKGRWIKMPVQLGRRQPEAPEGFDLRLMSSLNDVSGIATEDKNLIIVAAVKRVLHFRIFDGDGKVVVDTDEKRLTEQAQQIEDLRKQLESLWPPHEPTRSDKGRVITAVTSIVGHTPPERDLSAFYHRLLAALRDAAFRDGQWRFLEPREEWSGNPSHRNFVAYSWTFGEERRLVVVNLSSEPAKCFLPLGLLARAGQIYEFCDLLSDVRPYTRDGDDLVHRGLFLSIPGYGCHVFKVVERPKKEVLEHIKNIQTFRGHEQQGIYSLAWSPDGERIASAGKDGTILIWKARDPNDFKALCKHCDIVGSVAWSPDGRLLAWGSDDSTVQIWDVEGGKQINCLWGHWKKVLSVSWSPEGQLVASGSMDQRTIVWVWDVQGGEQSYAFWGQTDTINCVAWSPDGKVIASGSGDKTIRLWDVSGRTLLYVLTELDWVCSIAWSPDGSLLASGTGDGSISLWDTETGQQRATLEGHTARVLSVSFSFDGRIFASKSADETVRLWRCDNWGGLATLEEHGEFLSGVAFHPKEPILATRDDGKNTIRIWRIDTDALLASAPANHTVRYTNAKIVLVGESGVGKTGLGWRLTHKVFKDHPSTHGQQFWVLDRLKHTRRLKLKSTRGDEELPQWAECEAVLWDLGGQPDYRLIHALFLDDADLALVLFNPTNRQEPLHGVDYWLKALDVSRERPCRIILVGARIDVGSPTLTRPEIDAFCRNRRIGGGYIATSAKHGDGMDELVERMKDQIGWDEMPFIVTTDTFKRIKDFVLRLKDDPARTEVLTDPANLRRWLQETDPNWTFSFAEMMQAVKHLAKYGYVREIRTSTGERLILLAPELLNNLAASFVLEARRNPKGLGALEEVRVLKGEYPFPELNGLGERDRQTLLDAATTLFLGHNLCFRETNGPATFLIFPELINQKKPWIDEPFEPEDDVSYTVSGDVENAYATLVVLLGYTNVFTRTNQWQNQAQYAMEEREVCGFRRLETGHEGKVEFVVYCAKDVDQPTRLLFQGLFERFLTRRRVQVTRYRPVVCPSRECGYRQGREEVIRRVQMKRGTMFCSACGAEISLTGVGEVITPGQSHRDQIDQERGTADERTKYESALVTVKSLARKKRPTCFISYAWGEQAHEQWVEKRLARDLLNAGVEVILDRWHNTPGSSILKFIERINSSDFVIAMGTRKYLEKYQTEDADPVVDAELRLIGTLLRKRTTVAKRVIPLLRDGTQTTSFPPLFEDSVYIDFQREESYFLALFDLNLTLYGISPDDLAVAELRKVLNPETLRS